MKAPMRTKKNRFRLSSLVPLLVVALSFSAILAPAILYGAGNPPKQSLPRPLGKADFLPVHEARAKLGQLLFYERALSGNYRLSCATCHHHDQASSDGKALPARADEGVPQTEIDPRWIAQKRPDEHLRNAPALFNIGARSVDVLFHDGRIRRSLKGEGPHPVAVLGKEKLSLSNAIRTPLQAQALFPLTSTTEMAGNPGENEIADAVFAGGRGAAYDLIAERVRSIDEYWPLFNAAFPKLRSSRQIDISHIVQALEAFTTSEWRSLKSPFNRFLTGDEKALSEQQKIGMALFYGKANCGTCHSGALLSDQNFYSIAMPQIIRAKEDGTRPALDKGREAVTGQATDRFLFRTPRLHNVEHTAPYGHSGVFETLEKVVRHHLDPAASLKRLDARSKNSAVPDSERITYGAQSEVMALIQSSTIKPIDLSDEEVAALVSFLKSLSDPQSLAGRLGKPEEVPSGLLLD